MNATILQGAPQGAKVYPCLDNIKLLGIMLLSLESDDGLSLVTRLSTSPPPPCIFRNFEWKVAVADFASYRKKKIIKSRFLEGHLNTILAPWGGHLSEPIFNSSNAPGLPWGMLELRMDRHVTS